MKPLYKRLGIQRKEMPVVSSVESFHKLLDSLSEAKDPDDIISFLSSDGDILAFYFYYTEQTEEAKKYARLSIDYTLEYFFGKWREEKPIDKNPPDPVRRKKFEPWERDFRQSIFWASCLDEWDKVKKLAEYPTDECPVGRYEPKLFCYWLLTLAAVLRGEPLEDVKEYTNKVANSRRKYYTTMLSMLEAILDKNSVKFNKLLKEHLDHCNIKLFYPQPVSRKEIKKAALFINFARSEGIDVKVPQEYAPIPVPVTDRVARDGTFLINFALYKGLNVQVPPEYTDRIVRLKDCDSQVLQNA